VLRTADIDRGRALRVVFGAVHVRPCRGMQHEVGVPEYLRRRRSDVPVGVRKPNDILAAECLDERVAELPTRARD
jgi:hypothetical protein